jgi:hypothetical protein
MAASRALVSAWSLKISFNEHLVRAGEVRLALTLGRPEVSQQLRATYAAWIYLPLFEAQLQRYEADRQCYPTLESFLPVLINALSQLTPERIVSLAAYLHALVRRKAVPVRCHPLRVWAR